MTGRRTEDAAARWLRADRFAGTSATQRRETETQLAEIRDRVLDGAQISPGDHVVDLGAGTGLLTLGALSRVGPDGTVTAVDRSGPALREIRPAPGGGRLRLVVADVARLPLENGSVDAVVARSTLIYLEDLAAVLGEAARVLRPGGRLSVFEPVNARRRHDADLIGIAEAELRAITAASARATPAARTMTGFSETTTAALAAGAGFRVDPIHLGEVRSTLPDQDAVRGYLHRRPHPGAPTPLDMIGKSLGRDLADRYATAWYQAVAQQPITFTTPVMYLTASRF